MELNGDKQVFIVRLVYNDRIVFSSNTMLRAIELVKTFKNEGKLCYIETIKLKHLLAA